MQRSASVVKMIIRQVALKREVEPAKKAAPKLRAVEAAAAAAAKMAMEEAGSEWDGDFSEEEQEEGEPVTVKAAPKR